MPCRLWVLVAFCGIAAAADLPKEDLGSVQQAFQKKDASLDWFWPQAMKTIDSGDSVMIVQAAPRSLQTVGPKHEQRLLPVPQKTQLGVFVVSGVSNRVRVVLDVFPVRDAEGNPKLGEIDAHSVNLDYYSDYGMYRGSVKYIFDPAGGKPPLKFRYGMLELTSATVRGGTLVYAASSLNQASRVTIEPLAGGVPTYRIVPVASPEQDLPRPPVVYRLGDGTTVQVVNTPVGSSHQPAGFSVGGKLYPEPVSTRELYGRMRADDPPAGELDDNIGPSALAGSTIWFTNGFYDGEGTSGVGALGSFDVRTHQYTMRRLPEIAHWSGSAIRIDGDDIWIGLMRQPEGSAYGGGLLRYDTKTGAVTKYPVMDFVYTINRLGDTVYCGTSNGVYTIRDEAVTQLRFEPDARGKITMIASRKD